VEGKGGGRYKKNSVKGGEHKPKGGAITPSCWVIRFLKLKGKAKGMEREKIIGGRRRGITRVVIFWVRPKVIDFWGKQMGQ